MINFKEFTQVEDKTSILEEGGVAGHMSHIYDNWDLTFSQIKDILAKASQGQLEGTEKTDGQNLFISYSVKDGRAKAVRNKTNIKGGGLNVEQLRQMFANRGPIEDTFGDALRMFEKAVRSLSPQQQEKIFGPDANIYYNAEVMDPRSSNVINYDNKILMIHQVGHAQYDKQTGQAMKVDVTPSAVALDNAIDDMQERVQDDNYYIIKNAVRNLEALENDTSLKRTINGLDSIVNRSGLNNNSTIKEYLIKKIEAYLVNKLPQHIITQLTDLNVQDSLINKILGEKGYNINTIVKNIDPDYKKEVKEIAKDKNILKNAIYPIEDVVHDFTVDMLKGVQSLYVINNKKEVRRLKKEVANAIRLIQTSDNEIAHEVLKKQLKKLKSVDKINTAIEGFVFDYDGHSYKFTGNFAPINQILGLFKYGRAGVDPQEFNT